jgi:Fe-S-cluster containining protein
MDSFPATVQVNFTLALGEGRMNASVEVPAGEVTVTQLLPVLQGLTSRIVAGVVAQVEAAGRRISCRAGCGACCRQIVPLSIFEAEALAQWIRSLPVEQQQAVQSRFHAALLALRDKGILDRITPELWEEGSHASRELVIEYQAAGVPCPFLVDESCSIHPIRPLVCREYLVTSPPVYCAEPRADQVAGVHMPIKLSKALYRLGSRIEQDTTGWIPLVFLFHWMKSAAEPGKQLAGPGPRVLYEVISELGS